MVDTTLIEPLFLQAVALHQSGRLADAQQLYQQILELEPAHADANHNLGVLAIQLNQPESALPFLLSAWESNPDIGQYWASLGECLIAVDQKADAINVLQEAISNGLESEEIRLLLLQAKEQQTDPISDSVLTPNTTVTDTPKVDLLARNTQIQEALTTLSDYYQSSRFVEAVAYARCFVQRWPQHVFGWSALVGSLAALDNLQEAEMICREAMLRIPNNAALHNDMGAILCERGFLEASVESCQVALELQPDYVEAYNNLGNAYKEMGHFDKAEAALLKALELNPLFATAHNNLGDALQRIGRLIEAESALRHALKIRPEYVAAHHNLGVVLMDLGRPIEADESYKRALEIRPGYAKTLHNRLYYYNYRPDMDAEEVFEWYKRYGERVTLQVEGHVISHNDWSLDTKRPLRIGYVSPDFRGHACRFFMEPFLREHNRHEFEIFAYSNMPFEDQYTQRLKDYCDHWVDIFRLQDDAAAAQIAAHKIDVLVDLAGHSKGNRLMVFARKPAPVQLTYLGYENTTGLTEIDYFLADKQLVPEKDDHLFSEAVWHLPVSMCYQPPRELTPDVAPLPALRNGFVTFGSMLRVVRLNEGVIRVWCEILRQVPNARLRLYQEPFKYSDMRLK